MLGFVKSNQVTLFGSNDAKRSNQAPDVPAIAEVVPKFDFSVAVGVLARSGTPQDIIKKLSDEIAQAVKSPDVVEKFTTAGIEAIGASPDAYAKAIEQENTAMAKAGKAADLKAE
jgi:tripartite-type tricarboxylate transporter receptor subunit TctC